MTTQAKRFLTPAGAALIVAALALLASHAWIWRGVFVDDPYITFRYARNVARGLGPVFNPGERVEGYSSLLWVLMAAPFERWGSDWQQVRRSPAHRPLQLLGLACAAALVLALGRMADTRAVAMDPHRLDPSPSPIQTSARHALLRLDPLFLTAGAAVGVWAVSGLETLFYSLALFTVWRLASPLASLAPDAIDPAASTPELPRPAPSILRPLALGFTLVLLGLTRIEGQGITMVVLLWAAWRWFIFNSPPRKGLVPALAIAFAGLVAYQVWRVACFGDWIPNVVRAKTGGPLGQRFHVGAAYLWDTFRLMGGPFWLLACAGNFLPAFRSPAPNPLPVDRTRCPSSSLALLLAIYHGTVVLIAGGDWMPAHRLVVPLLPFAAFYAGQGLRELLSLHRPAPSWTAGIIGLGLLFWPVLAIPKESSLLDYRSLADSGRLWEPLVATAEWLHVHLEPDADFACMEIGVYGYFSDRKMTDLAGLTDRAIARIPQALQQRNDAEGLLERKPDYLLLAALARRDAEGRPEVGLFPFDNALLTHPRFHELYEPVISWPRYEPRQSPCVEILFRARNPRHPLTPLIQSAREPGPAK